MPEIDLDAVLADLRDDLDRALKDLFAERRRDVARGGAYRVFLQEAIRSGCSSDEYRALEHMERWLGPAVQGTLMTVLSDRSAPDFTELRRYLPRGLRVKVSSEVIR